MSSSTLNESSLSSPLSASFPFTISYSIHSMSSSLSSPTSTSPSSSYNTKKRQNETTEETAKSKKPKVYAINSPIILGKVQVVSECIKMEKKPKKTLTIMEEKNTLNFLCPSAFPSPCKPPTLPVSISNAIAKFDANKLKEERTYQLENAGNLQMTIGVSQTQGTRAYMEDCSTVCSSLYDDLPGVRLCAIYDGHNGAYAAKYASEHFHQMLAKDIVLKNLLKEKMEKKEEIKLSAYEIASIKDSIAEAFMEIDEEIIRTTIKNEGNDGSTALVCLFIGKHAFVANVGDTRCVLVRKNGDVIRASVDHKPNLLTEKRRIEECGGHILYSGCWRVACTGVGLRLAVSRSFGDRTLKQNLPKRCVAPLVIAQPDISYYCLDENDQYIILGSDGIWDRITDHEAAQTVKDEMEKITDAQQLQKTVKETSSKLISLALNRKSYDNITAMVVALRWS